MASLYIPLQLKPVDVPADAGAAGKRRRRLGILLVILTLLAVLPYINATFNSFVHDDTFQVVRNPYVRSASHLREIFTSSVWSFTGTDNSSNYYRPMMTAGYLVCYQLFGLAPFGFHLFNVIFHAGVVFLLFFITGRLFHNQNIAFAAAAIFALHPIHSESVAWIAAVTDLELTFFYLLTFWFFIELDQPGNAGRRLLGMVATFALALLSKEQAMTLPLLTTVYEHGFRGDRGQTILKQKLSRYGPLWLLAVAYVPWRVYCLGGFAPDVKFADTTRYQSVLSAFALIGQYGYKLLWPVHLHAYYLFQKSVSIWEDRVLAGVMTCILSAAFFWWVRKRSPMTAFGVIWVAITFAPVLNAKWLGANAFTERYAYLPSAGFCWVAGIGLCFLFSEARRARSRAWHRGCMVAITALAVLCAIRIATRNRDWRDNVVFYSRTLANLPNVPAANELRLNLAEEYRANGELEAAERELRFILRSEPENFNVLQNLAAVLSLERRSVEAIEAFSKVVQIAPARARATAHGNLGVAYLQLDMFDKAESELQQAITLDPKNVNPYLNLALVYVKKGDRTQGERTLLNAHSISPTNSQALYSLGSFYEGGGRPEEAIREYEAALQNDPGNAAARAGLRRLSGSVANRLR